MPQPILAKRQDARTRQTVVRFIAAQGISFDTAKPAGTIADGTRPYGTRAIYQDRVDTWTRRSLAGQVVLDPIANPMRQTLPRANPKTSISGCGKRKNEFACELLTLRRLPRQEPGAIEMKESKFCAHPQIAIRSLG